MKASLALYLLPLAVANPVNEPIKKLQARDLVCTRYGCGYKPSPSGKITAATGQKYHVYTMAVWTSGVSLISRTFGTDRQACANLCGQASECSYWTQFVSPRGAPYCETFKAASTPTQPTCQDANGDFETGKLIR